MVAVETRNRKRRVNNNNMKTKRNKKPVVQEIQNFSAPPPWWNARTKNQAYHLGLEQGAQERRERFARERAELEKQRLALNAQEKQAHVEIIRSMAQLADAAAHLAMSFRGQL